ncbi:hypothetical protein NQ318_001629 [Aromia moschata]|uniref:DUF4780 domain-containing protein n=1 Tax=Aromia moschata TaxID=1265417 RepID=A0AAV8Y192_9CUCU|nr:hypothetical protein NQ318_001629 [Aromia moschata]
MSLLKKIPNVLQKDAGFIRLKQICDGTSSESLSAFKDYFNYANITSVDVERSFSNSNIFIHHGQHHVRIQPLKLQHRRMAQKTQRLRSRTERRRKARLAKEATTTVVPPQQPQPSSSTNVEGTVKLDPPAAASGSSTGATSFVVGATGRPRGSYGPRRTEAPAKKRQRTPGSTPDAAGASKRPKPGTPRSWQAGFAQVVSGDKSLQIVIGREGQTELPFSESQLLEFLDAVREAITVTPTASETPLQFRSTTLWRGQLLVNAANAASRDWLLRSLNNIRPWSDVRLVALDPQTLRLRRALVWVPGKKPLPDKDTLSVLEKQNPGLACSKWKIWSRKEEPQGLGLVVGIDEKSIPTLERLDFQPYFSATRARVTLTARHTKSKGGTAKAGTAKADTSYAPNEEEGSAVAEPPESSRSSPVQEPQRDLDSGDDQL